jgi:hypothetical protein
MFERRLVLLHIVDGPEGGLLSVEEAAVRCEWQVALEEIGGACSSCSSPIVKSEVLSLMLFHFEASSRFTNFRSSDPEYLIADVARPTLQAGNLLLTWFGFLTQLNVEHH